MMATDFIPREELFAPASCMAIKASPNGQMLAYVGENKEGAMNLFVSKSLSLEGAQQMTHFSDPEIRIFFWSPDGKKLLFLKDRDGTRQYHLYGLDLESGELIDYTKSYEGVRAKIFTIHQTENRAVIGINKRNPQFHDLFQLDIDSGALSLIYQNDEYINFLFDEKLNPVLKTRIFRDGSVAVEGAVSATICSEDAFHTEWLKYTDGALYLIDNRGCDTTELKKLIGGKEILLGCDVKSDIQDVVFEEGHPIAFATYYTTKEWHLLDKRFAEDFDLLFAKMGQNFSIVDQTPTTWIIQEHIPSRGTAFWLFKRQTRELTCLLPACEEELAEMQPLVIRSRDGLDLVCYLTLPKSQKKPFPLVVVPHGGPFKVRDFYNFSADHQWLANRGYAVLSVNFRLSAGFGKAFVNAGNREWGGKAHLDVLDAVEWCVKQGIADRNKLAVLGASYGGYEALASLAYSPDIFACAVAICGPSHLKTVLDNVPFYWEIPSQKFSSKMHFFTKNAFFKSMGGDPSIPSELDYLENCSPLNYVDQIQKPLMLVHGANDPIVAVEESDQIYQKMKESSREVLYLFFPDEGHGISKFANKLCYLAHAEEFLSRALGGTCEPFPELNASAIIRK